MGIEVTPHERDDDSGASRLSVRYGGGSVETPLRLVTRNDLNAKSTIGADVPVTVGQTPFICEHQVNPVGVRAILNTNGYLAQVTSEVNRTLSHVDHASLRVVYPKLTQNALSPLGKGHPETVRVAKFLLDLMSETPADAYALQYELLGDQEWIYLQGQSTPVIPVVDIGDSKLVTRALEELPKRGAPLIPFIGFTYSAYGRANLSYEAILAARPGLHEKGIGIMVLGTPHLVGGTDGSSHDISAPHYSSFLIADVVGQMYYSHGGKSPRVTRVFEKTDLAVPIVSRLHDADEHIGEDAPFTGDAKLQELFWRTMRGQNTEEDWKKQRVPALSRLHEVVQSAGEYGAMRKFISTGELGEYRRGKARLAALLNRERPLADPTW